MNQFAYRVRYELKRAWKDGTRAVLLSPFDLCARVCALIPRPGFNMVRYYGCLSSHSALGSEVVPKPPTPVATHCLTTKTKGSSGCRLVETMTTLGTRPAPPGDDPGRGCYAMCGKRMSARVFAAAAPCDGSRLPLSRPPFVPSREGSAWARLRQNGAHGVCAVHPEIRLGAPTNVHGHQVTRKRIAARDWARQRLVCA
jgi:hypothetical protein